MEEVAHRVDENHPWSLPLQGLIEPLRPEAQVEALLVRMAEPYHRFTEPMPRQVAVGGVCMVCERDIHDHEGPSGPRNYC